MMVECIALEMRLLAIQYLIKTILKTQIALVVLQVISSNGTYLREVRFLQEEAGIISASLYYNKMIEIKDSSEHIKVINENKSVVLDFWAPWCGPCKAIMPLLEKLSKDYTDVTFAKISVEDNKAISDLYNVSAVPTLVYLRNGEVQYTQQGISSQSSIEEKINSIID
jgi:thioredoxin